MKLCVAKYSRSEMRPCGDLKQAFSLMAFAAVFLASSGAFDTERAALLPRLSYWLLMSFVSTAALEGGHRLLRWWSPAVSELRLRFYALTGLALPLTSLALVTCKLVFGGYPKFEDLVALAPGMAGILVALQLVLAYSPGARMEQRPPAQEYNALTSVLPLPLRGARIHALQAEDHYVRVYTSAGQALVRSRMRDAVAAVDGAGGFKPHRSWWVSQQSVTALRRNRGRAVLTISGGQQVPVSRTCASGLGPDFDAGEIAD